MTMRRSEICGLILCVFVLVQATAGPLAGFPKLWFRVPRNGPDVMTMAHMVVRANTLLMGPVVSIHMEGALGAWWSMTAWRFRRFRIFFTFHRTDMPWIWYRCRGLFSWSPGSGKQFLGGIGDGTPNDCWRI